MGEIGSRQQSGYAGSCSSPYMPVLMRCGEGETSCFENGCLQDQGGVQAGTSVRSPAASAREDTGVMRVTGQDGWGEGCVALENEPGARMVRKRRARPSCCWVRRDPALRMRVGPQRRIAAGGSLQEEVTTPTAAPGRGYRPRKEAQCHNHFCPGPPCPGESGVLRVR